MSYIVKSGVFHSNSWVCLLVEILITKQHGLLSWSVGEGSEEALVLE